MKKKEVSNTDNDKNQQPLISIIIPMYNCAGTIEATIRSVLEQSYSNYELVLVDDESTDNTVDICNKLLEDKLNWKLCSQKNSGPSNARNKGISEAEGEFIIFLDSDDIMDSEMLEKMIQAQCKNDVDLVICGFTYVRENGNESNLPLNFEGNLNEISAEVFYKYFYDKIFNAPWNKLYKKRIIRENNIAFDSELSILEDLLFSLEYLRFTTTMFVISEALYYYNRLSTGGLLNKYYDYKEKAIFKSMFAMEQIEKRINTFNNMKRDIYMVFLKEILHYEVEIMKNDKLTEKGKREKIAHIRNMREYKALIKKTKVPSGLKDKIIWLGTYKFPDILLRGYVRKIH